MVMEDGRGREDGGDSMRVDLPYDIAQRAGDEGVAVRIHSDPISDGAVGIMVGGEAGEEDAAARAEVVGGEGVEGREAAGCGDDGEEAAAGGVEGEAEEGDVWGEVGVGGEVGEGGVVGEGEEGGAAGAAEEEACGDGVPDGGLREEVGGVEGDGVGVRGGGGEGEGEDGDEGGGDMVG